VDRWREEGEAGIIARSAYLAINRRRPAINRTQAGPEAWWYDPRATSKTAGSRSR